MEGVPPAAARPIADMQRLQLAEPDLCLGRRSGTLNSQVSQGGAGAQAATQLVARIPTQAAQECIQSTLDQTATERGGSRAAQQQVSGSGSVYGSGFDSGDHQFVRLRLARKPTQECRPYIAAFLGCSGKPIVLDHYAVERGTAGAIEMELAVAEDPVPPITALDKNGRSDRIAATRCNQQLRPHPFR